MRDTLDLGNDLSYICYEDDSRLRRGKYHDYLYGLPRGDLI